MCFTIPYKIVDVEKKTVIIENGRKIYLGKIKSKVQKGDYVRCVGEIAVDVLSDKDGLAIRQLIKSLND